MDEKAIMLIIYILFGVAIILVAVGLLAYTGQINLPSRDFWGMLGGLLDLLEAKLPPI